MVEPEGKPGIPPDAAKRRLRQRNVAIAWGLALLIALFYLITIFKMGGNVLRKPY